GATALVGVSEGVEVGAAPDAVDGADTLLAAVEDATFALFASVPAVQGVAAAVVHNAALVRLTGRARRAAFAVRLASAGLARIGGAVDQAAAAVAPPPPVLPGAPPPCLWSRA